MTGGLVHHLGVNIIVTTCAFHHGRVRCHANNEAALVATTAVRVISTTIVAIEDQKRDSNERHVKATTVTSAKLHFISRLRGGSSLLDTA